jgi:putative membrane protein
LQVFSLLWKEWKALISNKKVLIPMIAVLLIPLLYSGMFLWAFWDPYGKLHELPVAVVNEDKGAVYNGEKLEIGSDLIENLKENRDFKWDFVDKKTAEKGLENQKYYMMIEIPSDFSKNATTLMNEEPKKLELVYVPNESFNFLSAQIGNTAVKGIKESIANTLSETYAESVFENLNKLADGVHKASEGATKIDEGAAEINDGAEKLQTHLEELAKSSVSFKEGLQAASTGSESLGNGLHALSNGLGKMKAGQEQLLDGAEKAKAGTNQLTEGLEKSYAGMKELNEKLPALTAGSSQLSQGTQSLSNSLSQWKEGAEQTKAGAHQLSTGLEQFYQALQGVLAQVPEEQKVQLEQSMSQLITSSKQLEGGIDKLSSSAGEISQGAAVLAQKMDELHQGQAKVEKGVQTLTEGQSQLLAGAKIINNGQEQIVHGLSIFGEKLVEAKSGAEQLVSGNGKLSTGLGKLAEGSEKLKDGSHQLADGASNLKEGTDKLTSGTHELAEKLSEAAKETSKIHSDDQTYEMMADPVKVDKKKFTEVPNYGTGFTPYFLSLGLFVGALLLSIVFPLRDPVDIPTSPFSWFISKFGILAVAGILQALIADIVLLLTLNIEVESVPLFIVFSIITSITFMALIQFLVTTMSDPGRFIGIIILILQLTTSAGTFPVELIPDFLQHFHAWLPMTYSVFGFKAVISSGDFAMMWENAGKLLVFTVLMVIGTLLYFSRQHKRKYETLES